VVTQAAWTTPLKNSPLIEGKFMLKKNSLALILALLTVLMIACQGNATTEILPTEEAAASSDRLILATTTSTENSGLLAYILPDFEAAFDVTVDVVAVGTGQALALGESGDADVLLVHARSREDEFIAEGKKRNKSKEEITSKLDQALAQWDIDNRDHLASYQNTSQIHCKERFS